MTSNNNFLIVYGYRPDTVVSQNTYNVLNIEINYNYTEHIHV